MKAEDYHEEFRDLEGIMVRITLYKIAGDFYCHIYNADPGATIARASANDRETALQQALEKATARIARSVKRD